MFVYRCYDFQNHNPYLSLQNNVFIVNITISNFQCTGTVQQHELCNSVNSAGLVVEILTLLGIKEATTAILLYKYRTIITNTVYWSNVVFIQFKT